MGVNMAENNLNGYSVMAESYRKLLAQEKKKPGMNKEELEELEAHIRVYETLASFEKNDKFLAFDSSMFNDICIGYVKAALRNIEANGSRQEREAANRLYSVLPGTITALFDTTPSEEVVKAEPDRVTDFLERLNALWLEYDTFISENADSPILPQLKEQCERLSDTILDVRARNDYETMQKHEELLKKTQALLTRALAIRTADEKGYKGGERELKILIEQLPLKPSARTALFNSLCRRGITSPEELNSTPAHTILRFGGVGEKYVNVLLSAGLIKRGNGNS